MRSSEKWYGGNALVDAEVCGSTNDWGTSLIDGGKVCFGIGNSDITIKSVSASYNNNAWHFVTATRNATAGSIVLYVDGVSVASTTGTNTSALNAPALIGLGRNPCSATAVYTGSLDDIVFYNRALSSTEVSNMFASLSAFTLPLEWISFTGTYSNSNVVLQWQTVQEINNDHFEIEDATDGIHFSLAGNLRANTLPAVNGAQSYSFSIANPASGNHYYHIKQVDKDGAFTYSSAIQITVRNNAAGFLLQTNPVANQLVLLNQSQAMIQQIQIVDLSGRVISSQLLQTNNTVVRANTNKLLPGYYLLRVVTANGNSLLPVIKR